MFFILWFLFIILPVLFAGITFILFLKLLTGKFDFPLDAGLKWRGKRIFGDNKTVKGPLLMSFFTMIYGYLFFQLLRGSLDLNYSRFQILLNFWLIGLSYSLGELPNSFLKRQLGILPGEQTHDAKLGYLFTFLDLFDSLFLVGLFYLLLFNVKAGLIIVSVIIGGFLHLFTDKLMVKLSLKKDFGKKGKN